MEAPVADSDEATEVEEKDPRPTTDEVASRQLELTHSPADVHPAREQETSGMS